MTKKLKVASRTFSKIDFKDYSAQTTNRSVGVGYCFRLHFSPNRVLNLTKLRMKNE